jgi:hypothetical protein
MSTPCRGETGRTTAGLSYYAGQAQAVVLFVRPVFLKVHRPLLQPHPALSRRTYLSVRFTKFLLMHGL